MTTYRGDNQRVKIIVLCAFVIAALACRSNQTNANSANANNAPAANASSAQANQNAGQDQPDPSPANQNASPAATPGDPSSQEFEGTAGVVEKRRPEVGPVVLRSVRLGSHSGFDRVVFEFEGGNL
ncbi:MAG TPA: hypothetical protein VJQ56_10710, partial [Blastocatellia bacterium]|nr:hypothetical protein [Blastocatellia bacterium]